MARAKLPIGIQNFREIRTGGFYYVDKTPYVGQLAQRGKYYFLSRPRRFGKSLFLDTLAEAFAGNRELFLEHPGDAATPPRPRLALADDPSWNWEAQHPVLRLSFAEGTINTFPKLERHIHALLDVIQSKMAIPQSMPYSDPHLRFGKIIEEVANHWGKSVVVLIDEYDKPILDNINNSQIIHAMHDGLRDIYSVLKGRDDVLRFVFLTGVSKFSKVSLFSGLNNLEDITLDSRYSAICGYTEEDLDTVFAPEMEGLDREEVRRWYNGYSWDGTKVYNPFDILLLFSKRQFHPWWFETATPRFLVEWLGERRFFTPYLEGMVASDRLLSAFDVEAIRPEAMLWQTGYLTIAEKHYQGVMPLYRLRVPNMEVRAALNGALLDLWHPAPLELTASGMRLYDALLAGDAQAVRGHLTRLFASIPADWYRNNPIAQYEGYYASVFYSYLASLGLETIAEDPAAGGYLDLTLKAGSTIWLFEFKVIPGDHPSGTALAQIHSRNYRAKYQGSGAQVLAVGVEFSASQRQIIGWEVEE